MRRRTHRIMALFLAIVMLCSSAPSSTLAQETEGQDQTASSQENAAAQTQASQETKDEQNGTEADAPASQEGQTIELEQADFTAGIRIAESKEDGTQTYSPVKDILVRLYQADQYVSGQDNIPAAEKTTGEDGLVMFADLTPGEYRIEYIDQSETFDMEDYENIPLPEDAGYTLIWVKDQETGEENGVKNSGRDYFACIENYIIADQDELFLDLKKKDTEAAAALNDQEADETLGSSSAETDSTGNAVTDNDPSETEEGENSQSIPDGAEKDNGQSGASANNAKPKEADKPVTVETLKSLDNSMAAAATALDIRLTALSRLEKDRSMEGGWSFDAYYVNESDSYHVEKTRSFNLKYQMEFHTDQNLKSGEVEIRIPQKLFDYRDGTAILPADIAVPEVSSKEEHVESRSTPFNYYVEEKEGTSYLVFFNYRDIIAGSNAAWQVLYKDLQIMEITDETSWKLQPQITVTIQPAEGSPEVPATESRQTTPLTGQVDSTATLSSVTKQAYEIPNKNYGPGLYKETQVEKYIDGGLPEKYQENFKDYNYVLWDVTVKGDGTQPWNLAVKEQTEAEDVQGEVVGYKNYEPVTSAVADTGRTLSADDFTEIRTFSKESSWTMRLWVVTAYPADETPAGTVTENSFTVQLTPYDGKDKIQEKTASAKWSYEDYDWHYEGSVIGVDKGEKDVTHSGWLDVYRATAENKNEDFGSIPFTTRSIFRGYGITHYVDSEAGELGEYKEGTSYTLDTIDDFLYLYPAGEGEEGARILSDEDYYFSQIAIQQKDTGYDVWEDVEYAPEKAEDIAQDMKVYAMFAGSDTWEFVADVPWNDTGILEYQFTPEQIAREPWRVRAVHETISYTTTCQIDVNVCLKADSPVMAEVIKAMDEENMTSVQIENISGIIGEEYDEDREFVKYWHDENTNPPNYSEPGLIEATKALYPERKDGKEGGLLLQRGNALHTLTALTKHAASYKTVRTANDPQNSRTSLTYCLTAYDGYEIYGEEGVSLLKSSGVTSPGRNEVAFYDLLPYGVRLDPSAPIKAGRITSLESEIYKTQPNSWDSSQVTVTVDPAEDIIPDYNGTGRMMVVFHIKYEGADSAVFTRLEKDAQSGNWIEGWGVSFQAYYDWMDLNAAQAGVNVSAFMPEDAPGTPLYNQPLYGKDTEVACDDGIIVPSGTFEDDYKYFGSDINKDKVTDIRNVLYARAETGKEDFAVAVSSGVEKRVRSDADRFGVYGKSAVTEPGGGYTYDISVRNTSQNALKDIVFYDRLENAAVDRADANDPLQDSFANGSWYGTFQNIITTGLEVQGIAPVVYYNADRDAELTEGTETPGETLTEENGWYTEDKFIEEHGSLEEAKGIAVDISKKTDDTDFQLEEGQSVSFQIRMKAPDAIPEEPVFYAFNNPSYYSYGVETQTGGTVEGNAVKVGIGEIKSFEIAKEFEGEIPGSMQNTAFEFHLYQEDADERVNFSNREYQLFRKDAEGNYQEVKGQIYATDAGGCLTLRAGEKAVFSGLPEADLIHAEETENPYWKAETREKEENNIRTITVTNTYRPVLYAQKKLMASPDSLDISKEEFTFQLLAGKDGELRPVADAEFWYVDSVRTDGGIPNKVTGLGNNGTGMTNENGQFTIHAGEIIALFPDEAGSAYQLKEVDGSGEEDNWICEDDTVEGIVPVQGASATITNIYKWKELALTKLITHQDAQDCTQEFTFRITRTDSDGNETPVSGNEWVLLNADGTESSTKGTLNDKGEFTCAFAGKTVKIKGLEAGTVYVVEETGSGENYRPLTTEQETEMPVYSTGNALEFTNDYLLRPLSVTKIVNYDREDPTEADKVAEKSFTMTATVEGEPLADFPYTLTENGTPVAGTHSTEADGTFQLKNGQTAVFEDIGQQGTSFEVSETQDRDYPQIYPAGTEPHTGELGAEGAAVTFVNGQSGGLLISKQYEGGDEEGQEYVNLMKDPDSEAGQEQREKASVTMTLQITDSEGNKYTWPKTETKVIVVDQLTGTNDEKAIQPESLLLLKPWENMIIPADALEEAVSYQLTETVENQHKIFEWETGKWMEISQKDPVDDGAATGKIEEQPVAEIINQITSLTAETEIEKRMALGSDEVPEGADLVWILERFDGTAWGPAADVPYVVFDDAGAAGDRTLTTGTDGKITLMKTANGYPRVWFTEDKVVLNQYGNCEEGTLRLRELTGESHEAWGMLAGYGTADDKYGYSINIEPEAAKAFVNSNRTTPVEIEKKMDTPSDVSFTMILEQVVSASAKEITDISQIQQTQPGAGISYTVYDTESGRESGTGITGAKGEIPLKAGQYARLNLPDGTAWTVREERKADHELKEVTGTPSDKMTKLGDNLILIQAKAEAIPGALEATAKKSEVVAGETLNKADYTVTAYFSDGTSRELTPEEFTLSPETIPENAAEEVDITVRWTETGMETAIRQSVIPGITLTKEMVTTGVKDAESGDTVNLTSGEVTIPEQIIWEGKTYAVTGIGSEAFDGCTIKQIYFPDTLVTIENNAFEGCKLSGNLILPEGLQTIGDEAFANQKIDGKLNLPDSLTYLGNEAFYYCNRLTGDLKIPDGITTLNYGVFNRCSGFNGTLTVPNSVTSIESYAFRLCYNLQGDMSEILDSVTEIGAGAFHDCEKITGEIKFPDGITEIPAEVFQGCEGLTGALVLPDTVTSINDSAFSGCSGLTGDLIIPDSVTYMESGAFRGCTGLDGELKMSANMSYIPTQAFSSCGFTGELKIPDKVTSIYYGAFSNCSGFTGDLTIPEGVIGIGNYAFEGCSGFNGKLNLPEGLTEIGTATFASCSGLTGDLVIPEKVEEVGDSAFSRCSGFNGKLEFKSGLKYIRISAFEGCSGFTGILEIPNNVRRIYRDAFADTQFEKIVIDNAWYNLDGSPWGYEGTVEWLR